MVHYLSTMKPPIQQSLWVQAGHGHHERSLSRKKCTTEYLASIRVCALTSYEPAQFFLLLLRNRYVDHGLTENLKFLCFRVRIWSISEANSKMRAPQKAQRGEHIWKGRHWSSNECCLHEITLVLGAHAEDLSWATGMLKAISMLTAWPCTVSRRACSYRAVFAQYQGNVSKLVAFTAKEA
jgi:hypothetical protein